MSLTVLGRMFMCYGTAVMAYVFIIPGDQLLQAVIGGGLIGLGSGLGGES